ncbi:MAG: HlyD family efflux transporter periplasmic adaptor subunit [Planctomycetia bacterium]|nr:HlyD family efflux transporter periplasmic adaptor subunit [Planctomycetia bacterium]
MTRRCLPFLVLVSLFALGCEPAPDNRFGGYVEAEKIEVGSRVGGRVLEVLVDEGDQVTSGQLLVRFETEELQAELSESQHRAERLGTVWEKLKAGPRKQEIEVARQLLSAAEQGQVNAEATYKRGLEAGVPTLSQQELSDLETACKTATATAEARRQELNLLVEGTRTEDLTIARHELEEAEDRVTKLKSQLDEGEVHAPSDAVVEAIDLEPGDLVPGGTPLATLVRADELWVRCFVPSTLVTFVHVGDKVRVEVDSRPGESFAGEVLRVNRVAEYTPRNVQTFEQRQDQVFGVKVRVRDPEDALRPGMAATVMLDAQATAPQK